MGESAVEAAIRESWEEAGVPDQDGSGIEILETHVLDLDTWSYTTVIAKTLRRFDAVINDNGVLYDFAKENTDYAVGFDIQTGEQYGIAAKKGNTALIEKVDAAYGTGQENYERLLARRDRRTRDHTPHTLRLGLVELTLGFPVYRSYISARGMSAQDRGWIDIAVHEAMRLGLHAPLFPPKQAA